MKLCSRLHLSLRECQQQTDYFEFLQWIQFFKEEDEHEIQHVSKQDFYLAQIAAMVVATNSKNPKSIKVQDFLVKAETVKKDTRKLTKEERVARAKAFWAPLGMTKGKVQKRPLRKGKK